MPRVELEQETLYDGSWDEFGSVSVRRINRLKDPLTGEVVSQSYHRHVVTIDDDITQEPVDVQAIILQVRTPERAQRWKNARGAT